jgi:broad specificity phosphatase PhoE
VSVVLLVRHGQASFGKKDYDALSERGHEQARVLGRSLADRGVVPSVVLRGELRRHRETAEGILEGLAAGGADAHVPVEVDAGWDEFDFQHVVTALKPLYRSRLLMKADLAMRGGAEEFQKVFEEATERWVAGDNDDDYHEPFSMFAERVGQALRRAVEHSDGTVLVVSSGGPIAVAASELLTGDTSLWGPLTRVAVNTGVTKVVSGRRGVTLTTYNEHAHLEHDRAMLTYR